MPRLFPDLTERISEPGKTDGAQPFSLANTGCTYNSEKSERAFKRKTRPYIFNLFLIVMVYK